MKFDKVFMLNYPGKVDMPEDLVGPNTMGEYFRAVVPYYNEATDTTTIVFELA